MRYFVWVDFQYEMLALFAGAVSLILTYIAWGAYPKKRKAESSEEIKRKHGHERESGHDTEKIPIAPFIIYIYILIPFWAIAYMIYIWVTGQPVG